VRVANQTVGHVVVLGEHTATIFRVEINNNCLIIIIIIIIMNTTEIANVEVQNIFHGLSNITGSTNCKYRTAVTLFTLETWFVSGI